MDKLVQAKQDGIAAAQDVKNLQDLDAVRVNFLGKKGLFAEFMKELAKCDPAERPQRGAVINEAKQEVVAAIENAAPNLRRLLLMPSLQRKRLISLCQVVTAM